MPNLAPARAAVQDGRPAPGPSTAGPDPTIPFPTPDEFSGLWAKIPSQLLLDAGLSAFTVRLYGLMYLIGFKRGDWTVRESAPQLRAMLLRLRFERSVGQIKRCTARLVKRGYLAYQSTPGECTAGRRYLVIPPDPVSGAPARYDRSGGGAPSAPPVARPARQGCSAQRARGVAPSAPPPLLEIGGERQDQSVSRTDGRTDDASSDWEGGPVPEPEGSDGAGWTEGEVEAFGAALAEALALHPTLDELGADEVSKTARAIVRTVVREAGPFPWRPCVAYLAKQRDKVHRPQPWLIDRAKAGGLDADLVAEMENERRRGRARAERERQEAEARRADSAARREAAERERAEADRPPTDEELDDYRAWAADPRNPLHKHALAKLTRWGIPSRANGPTPSASAAAVPARARAVVPDTGGIAGPGRGPGSGLDGREPGEADREAFRAWLAGDHPDLAAILDGLAEAERERITRAGALAIMRGVGFREGYDPPTMTEALGPLRARAEAEAPASEADPGTS